MPKRLIDRDTESARLLAQYTEACNFPGVLDEQAVEDSLREYLSALGVRREIRRLRQSWSLAEEPALVKHVSAVLEDFGKRSGRKPLAARAALAARDARDARAAQDARAARDARDARAALAARDARDALDALAARDARDALDARAARDALDARAIHRFASWCIHRAYWWWNVAEVSWISTTYLGARQLRKPAVELWAKPLFEAYLAGCWLLHWTEDTLYWVAKPRVHVEHVSGRRQLHNENYATLESDVENLYFWHGVLVPAFVVVRPDWITVKHIHSEENAEVRRVMIERMGSERFIREAGGKRIHECADFCHPGLTLELYSTPLPGDPEGLRRDLRCVDPSTGREYFLRVPPQIKRADDAKAWTFGFDTARDYRPVAES